ncbi:aspartyl-tRNA(Asn)/glutamyl-tRNA(Gln) amidotransferase subunit C [Desulfitispora alkaliphila]|uniref:Asp-tRNA(Asn)/Glu-tRNA(Gln) amidotransferase subunit GatC n=1 Tax=Desulfitispora alkaliphila TaxID=622674 RepID=UPI003D260224
MGISKKDVEHVAILSRLELTETELEKYTTQLNDILGYVQKLEELDTSNVEPTAHVLPLKNVLRDDVVKDSLDQDEAFRNAPDSENGFFKVPKIG